VTSGGPGLLSPTILAIRITATDSLSLQVPESSCQTIPKIGEHVKHDSPVWFRANSTLTPQERAEASLSPQQIRCINHWNLFLKSLPKRVALPSFPIWGDEITAGYPFENRTPFASALRLFKSLPEEKRFKGADKEELVNLLPSYARTRERTFCWKSSVHSPDRNWFRGIETHLEDRWVDGLREFPPSLRKLEWNCQARSGIFEVRLAVPAFGFTSEALYELSRR